MNMKKYDRLISLFKCLMAAYVITGVLLMITAGLLYKFNLEEKVVDICIIVIYVISSLLMGLLYSKGAKNRRFLWGMGAGFVYFLIICIISSVVEPEFSFVSSSCITTFLICIGSGTLGGMIG